VRGRELEVITRLEVERRGFADELDRDGVFLRVAVGRVLGGRVRNAIEERLQRLFQLRKLRLERLQAFLRTAQLLELLRRRLAFRPLRTKLLDLRLHLTLAHVDGQQLVEQLRSPLARERGAVPVRVVAGGAEVDHDFESRSASRTCATPSSSADGHTHCAIAFTPSCAFATAIP